MLAYLLRVPERPDGTTLVEAYICACVHACMHAYLLRVPEISHGTLSWKHTDVRSRNSETTTDMKM